MKDPAIKNEIKSRLNSTGNKLIDIKNWFFRLSPIYLKNNIDIKSFSVHLLLSQKFIYKKKPP